MCWSSKKHAVRDDSCDGDASTESDIPSGRPSLHSEDSVASYSNSDENYVQAQDFSGKWKFSKFEGNFEAMMTDAGVSWAMRKMAKSGNYGIGLATQDIRQIGNELSIKVHNGPLGGTTMKLEVDGGEQESVGEDGACILVKPSWDGRFLRVEGKTKQGGRQIQLTRRYMCGEQMVIETTTSRGEVILRYFSRI
jgi:hypothetical protein